MTERQTAAKVEQVAVMRCPWGHVHLWPADIQPYPRECMAKVASLPTGEWPTCGKHMHVSRLLAVEDCGI